MSKLKETNMFSTFSDSLRRFYPHVTSSELLCVAILQQYNRRMDSHVPARQKGAAVFHLGTSKDASSDRSFTFPVQVNRDWGEEATPKYSVFRVTETLTTLNMQKVFWQSVVCEYDIFWYCEWWGNLKAYRLIILETENVSRKRALNISILHANTDKWKSSKNILEQKCLLNTFIFSWKRLAPYNRRMRIKGIGDWSILGQSLFGSRT